MYEFKWSSTRLFWLHGHSTSVFVFLSVFCSAACYISQAHHTTSTMWHFNASLYINNKYHQTLTNCGKATRMKVTYSLRHWGWHDVRELQQVFSQLSNWQHTNSHYSLLTSSFSDNMDAIKHHNMDSDSGNVSHANRWQDDIREDSKTLKFQWLHNVYYNSTTISWQSSNMLCQSVTLCTITSNSFNRVKQVNYVTCKKNSI